MPSSSASVRRASLIVLVLVLLVFGNCLSNAFVWDDEQFIVKNAYLTSWAYLPKLFTENVVAGAGLISNLYRPVSMLTHWLDVQVWGLTAWGHHLTTVLIHAAASVAVFRLFATLLAPRPAAVAALLGLSLWLWRRARPAAIGIWWFVAATLPTSNLLVLINAVFYDHWFILPGLGLMLAVGHLLAIAFTQAAVIRRLAMAVSIVAIAACARLTIQHNRIWRDPISLYTHVLSWEPASAKIHNNLAMAYADQGRTHEAIRLYQRAVALDDTFPQTHHNLGNAYLQLGDQERAMEEFQRAVAIDPRFHHSWVQLGFLQLARRNLHAAADAFERARGAYPYEAAAYLGLAKTHLAQGNPQAARAVLEAGLTALPHHPDLDAALHRLSPQ